MNLCACNECQPPKPVKNFTDRVVDSAFRLYENRPLSFSGEPYTWSDAIDNAIEVVTAEILLEDPLD